MYKIFVLHVKHFSEIVQIESYVASKSNVHYQIALQGC